MLTWVCGKTGSSTRERSEAWPGTSLSNSP
jgi:hypothetical protein